jgi:hypothetical protein
LIELRSRVLGLSEILFHAPNLTLQPIDFALMIGGFVGFVAA